MIEILGVEVNVINALYQIGLVVLAAVSAYIKTSSTAQLAAETVQTSVQSVTATLLNNVDALVTEAETTYDSEANEQKKAWVMEKLYGYIPDELEKYIPETLLSNMIDTTVTELKAFAVAKADAVAEKITESLTD